MGLRYRIIVCLILSITFSTCYVSSQLTPCVPSTDFSCDPNDIGFYLYPNAANPVDFDKLTYGDLNSISSSRFNSSKNVIILTHGYIQNFTSDMPVFVKDKYLSSGYAASSNIITVDWGKLSGANINSSGVSLSGLNYYGMAVDNVDVVGRRLADFLVFLVENGLTERTKVHLVGQSLGAHVSGTAGKYFKKYTGSPLARVTGTDPAGPLFELVLNSDIRIKSTDASFVDIYHVNQGEFGYLGNLGQVDFFINGGGPLQPGCSPVNASDPFCAHNLAPHYYAASIGTSNLMATLSGCLSILLNSCPKVIFGENCPAGTTGVYNIQMTL